MKKYLKPILMACALGSMLNANAEGYKSIIVSKTSGERVQVTLSDELQITLTDTDLVITEPESTVSIAKSEVQEFILSNEVATALTTPTADLRLSVANGIIRIDALAANSQVALYGIGGQVIGQYTASDSLTLPALPQGAYLLTINGRTFKVLIR